MSDDVALLAAIGEHPDEDTPRLVYADWLDEQGGEANTARAEFIRLQCELARNRRGARDQDTPHNKQLEERVKQLAAQFAKQWLAEFPGAESDSDSFNRGFLHSLSLKASKCSGPRPPWYSEPLVEVELTGAPKTVSRLFASGWFDGIAGLDLKPAKETDADALAEAAAGSGCAKTLRSLSLWNEGYGDRALRAVSKGGFERLSYFSCMGQFSPDGWNEVLNSPAAEHLEDLTVGHRAHWQTADQTRPGPGLAEVLTSAPKLSRLRTLWVSACGLQDEGVVRFASRARFPVLKRLSLDSNPFGETAAQALGAASFPSLTDLSMSQCELTDERLAPFVRSPLMGQLERLTMTLNQLTAASAKVIAKSGRTAGLKYLDLGCNPIRDEGVLALMRSASFPALEELHLSSTEMTDVGADEVFNAPWAERLNTLFMSYNKISKRKQKALTAKFGAALWINGVVED